MKKVFVIGIMLLATVTLATAQQRQQMSTEERAKVQTERMEKLLTLTADQKTKVQAIDLELSKEMTAKMQDNQGDRRAIMQEIDKKRDEKYKAVLTADQFKKYLEDKEQRQRERGQRN
jgi:hypothetical protein